MLGFIFPSNQIWCETNLRRCISKFHRFICEFCDKAFPLRSALDLHKTNSHPDKPTPTDVEKMEEKAKKDDKGATEHRDENDPPALPAEQSNFMEGLGLQHISEVHWLNYT